MAVFDKETSLWRSPINQQQPHNEIEQSVGQNILEAIAQHGSKLAQVFQLTLAASILFRQNNYF